MSRTRTARRLLRHSRAPYGWARYIYPLDEGILTRFLGTKNTPLPGCLLDDILCVGW